MWREIRGVLHEERFLKAEFVEQERTKGFDSGPVVLV